MNIKVDLDSFVNWKRYNKDGETELKAISLKDNFIIKGDNINVLQILLPIYKNKIKLICIDPPYNTGGNKFNYNDNYEHTKWLSFMEERLKIAKDDIIDAFAKAKEQTFIDNLRDRHVNVQFDSKLRGYIGEIALKKWFLENNIKINTTNYFEEDIGIDISLDDHEYLYDAFLAKEFIIN